MASGGGANGDAVVAMKRRAAIALLSSAAVRPLAALAQGNRRYRIGVLETVPAERNAANLDALRRGLRELGYVEGQNLQIEYRSAAGHADRFPELADELLRLGVDLILTRGTPAARAAKAATPTVPIVMAAIGEPLGVGVVASLARPGGNVTGFSAYVTELSAKRAELLKEAFPAITRVGFMQNMGNPVSPPQWEVSQAAAQALGISAELLDVRTAQDIKDAFELIRERRLDALSVGIDTLTQTEAGLIVELAARRRLLTAYPAREFVEVGGLLSYGPSYPDLYFRAAGMIDKIFKGARPGDLPVEQPTKLELVVNLKTARTLGIVMPPILLARADEVIE
jgi:putative tryptophan/tyrosine transport system substrate-binding protein